MNIGNITVFTPPERFFNLDSSYLLVNPSPDLIKQFQSVVSDLYESVNVFVYDTASNDLEWLLSVACQTDLIIIDIDNCTAETKTFVTFLLTHPNSFYITADEITPYNLISKNRIYDLDWFNEPDEFDIDDEEM
jgi:hypothetical protein